MPDLTLQADRCEVMDVRARQTRRVRALEGLADHTGNVATRDISTRCLAQEHLAFGQTRQCDETLTESGFLALEHHGRIRGQRMGIDGGNEDGCRLGIQRRHARERAGTQRRPQAGLDQLVDHDLTFETCNGGVAMCSEFHSFALRVDLDDHGQKLALLATIDLDHSTGSRRGVTDARGLLVGEQELPLLHLVPFTDFHRRLHTDVVNTQDRYATNGLRILDTLLRRPGDGEIQATFDFDHRLAQLSDLMLFRKDHPS